MTIRHSSGISRPIYDFHTLDSLEYERGIENSGHVCCHIRHLKLETQPLCISASTKTKAQSDPVAMCAHRCLAGIARLSLIFMRGHAVGAVAQVR